MASTAASISPL
ncbi:hypothetical protein D021_0310A, partial [Vibrio parahaemolyticus 10296]